jgi:hydroxymethylpyrimidine pyrophosphatase-like HAD family hydrolase
MKFGVLALDYDGTIARDGWLDPEVRAAIVEVRACGIAVVLVTGRILAELRQFAGSLQFVDAVVAENGAVLSFPNGNTRLLGHSAPDIFFEELRRRAVPFTAGQCVVETDAVWAPQVLAVIRELELPLTMFFNRGRLMMLPQAISKGIGLREALTVLRLSAHNAIGIGDAENDHDLLTACEFGVAVEWGTRLCKRSRTHLAGRQPERRSAIHSADAKEMRVPQERISRSPLVLGIGEDGRPIALSFRSRNILIAGEPRSGKSWVNGLACEQLILQGYSVCVIDAEGDYRTLETLPGVVVFGGEIPPPELPDLTRVLRHPKMSVVVDLSHVPYREKIDYLKTLLPMLASLRRTTGLPHRIVVDEAHYFLREPDVRELLDLDLGAYTLATYRLSDLHPDLRAAIQGIIVKRTTDPHEVHTLAAMVGKTDAESEWKAILGGLDVSEAVLLPGVEEGDGRLLRFRLLPRLTTHVRHKAKYLDVQLIEGLGFVFTDCGRPVGPPVRTLKEFVCALETLSLAVLEGHARRGDFSRWIANVFHDHVLASAIRKVEQRYRLGHTQNLYLSLAYPSKSDTNSLPICTRGEKKRSVPQRPRVPRKMRTGSLALECKESRKRMRNDSLRPDSMS